MILLKYYTYMYYDLINKEPFWIGKGKDNRSQIKGHLVGHNNYTFKNRLKSLGENNIRIQFLYRSNNEQSCLDKEIYWIDKIGRKDLGTGPLLNLTLGGDGVSGYMLTEEIKLKLKGRKTSEETKKRISRANKGRFAGEKHPNVKLTEKDVLEIREYTSFNNKLFKKYNVSKKHILNIINKKRWTHI